MKKFLPFLALALLLAVSTTAFPQTEDQAQTEIAEERKKQTLRFVRETLSDISNLRTAENRISFTSEIAALLWYHDEKQGRDLFNATTDEFKSLLSLYNSQVNMYTEGDNGTADVGRRGPMMVMLGTEYNSKEQADKRLRTALGVRQHIAMSLAEHEPEMAMNFFSSTGSMITNPQFTEYLDARDPQLEIQLIARIAATNASRAAELGRKSIDGGVKMHHIALLKSLHARDPEKARELGALMLTRAKRPTVDRDQYDRLAVIHGMLNLGTSVQNENQAGGDKLLFTTAELRELAESLATEILALDDSDEDQPGAYRIYQIAGYAKLIEKYSPSRASQIRQKFKDMKEIVENFSGLDIESGNEIRTGAEDDETSDEGEVFGELKSIEGAQVSAEQLAPLVTKARGLAASAPGRMEKVMILSAVATQIAKADHRELSIELMSEAAAQVPMNPKNYQDFMLMGALVSGYAHVDPERAFPIIEDAIMRGNGLISAFVRVGEFIDLNEEMIVDGEVQVGGFGGDFMPGMKAVLQMANPVIKPLAETDFARMAALTNRFDRPETRVLAKMLVLRALLDKPSPDFEMLSVDGLD